MDALPDQKIEDFQEQDAKIASKLNEKFFKIINNKKFKVTYSSIIAFASNLIGNILAHHPDEDLNVIVKAIEYSRKLSRLEKEKIINNQQNKEIKEQV